MWRLFIIFCVLLSSLDLSADVFTLWPFGTQKKQAHSAILDSVRVFDDAITINSIDLRLKTGLIQDSLLNCLFKLRTAYPQAKFEINNNTVKMTVDQEKSILRLLLVQLDGRFPVIEFQLELPQHLPEQFEWPPILPITPDARPTYYIHYGDRGIWYGVFNTSLRPATAVSTLTEQLLSSGWVIVPENALTEAPNGIIMIKNKPQSIMTMNFSASGQGAVLVRELK